MPPRKRTRVTQATSPAPPPRAKSPTPAPPAESPSRNGQLPNDAWTDEEEIGLFKGLIRWKPTGIHKHFRMVALHQYLLSNGYVDPKNEHTKPAGIWRKLETLYDLEALDAREDARQLSDLSHDDSDGKEADDDEDDDAYSEAENKIHNEDFTLPDEEFAELKWQQRFASDEQRAQESPPLLPEINMADVPPVRFTPSFSVEPSENTTQPAKSGRARGGTTRKARGGKATRRSVRQAESAVDETEGNEDQYGNEEDGEDDESEKEEGNASGQENTAARSTRAGRGTRDRNAPVRGNKRGRRGK